VIALDIGVSDLLFRFNPTSLGRKAFIILLLLSVFINIQVMASLPDNDNSNKRMLFLTESIADYELALDLNSSFNFNSDLIDIRTSEDLNILFLQEDYLQSYSTIILILSHISNPFNESMVNQITSFIESGGIFSIISAHIWQFTDNFHDLLGLSISMGQKIWPVGNSTEEITFTIYNDTFTRFPYDFGILSNITIQAEIGITSPLKESYRVIASDNTPIGSSTMNTFQKGSGFVIAAPITPINTFNHSFSKLLTSVIVTAENLVNDLNNENRDDNPSINLPLLSLKLSEEVIQISTILITAITFTLTIIYVINKWKQIRPINQIPRESSWLSTLLIAPILLIGKVVYPPYIRRINTYHVFENDKRKRIIKSLENREFLHFRELKRELGIGTSSLKWHLQVLEDFRVIKRQAVGQYEIFYLRKNPPGHELLEYYFAMKSGLGFRVAKAFSKEILSWDLSSLTDYLGVSKESVRYHCKKYKNLGLLRAENNRYYLNLGKKPLLLGAIDRRQKII
jgi:predicted transcriptional regulator